jgi:hypothetical protein
MANTTATPEQKQKTEVVRQFIAVTNAVSVVSDFQMTSINSDVKLLNVSRDFAIKEDYKPFSIVITNEELFSSNRQAASIHYRQKLNDNYNLHFKQNLLKPYKSTRADC